MEFGGLDCLNINMNTLRRHAIPISFKCNLEISHAVYVCLLGVYLCACVFVITSFVIPLERGRTQA